MPAILLWLCFSFINREESSRSFKLINQNKQISLVGAIYINREHRLCRSVVWFLFLSNYRHIGSFQIFFAGINKLAFQFLIPSSNNLGQSKFDLTNKIMFGEIKQFIRLISIIDLQHECLLSFKHIINIDALNPLRVQAIGDQFCHTDLLFLTTFQFPKDQERICE